MVYVLLVWAAFTTGLFVYFDSSITLHRVAPPAPASQADKDDELYTGSIVVVPRFGNDCWKMMIDNRTGRMWENGYVDCDSVVGTLAESERNGATSSARLNAIGAAFRDGR